MTTEIRELTETTVIREEGITIAPAAAGWNYRNLMFGKGIASGYMPALATHRGKMCCLFVNKGDKILYYAWGTSQSWQNPKVFTGAPSALVSPALADDGGVLHAVFTETTDNKHELVHYQYDDNNDQWVRLPDLAQRSSKDPALAGYHGQLFCAFVADNSSHSLLYTIWNPREGWRTEKTCNNEAAKGTPALCLVGGQLHLLFAANNDEKAILDLVYNEQLDSWSRAASQPGEAADYGVSATTADASSSAEAFMGFVKRNDGGDLLVSTYANGYWNHNEEVGQRSYDTPNVAVLDGYLNCAFTARNDSRELLWSQRPVSGLDLGTWMSSIDGGKLLSSLSIPGTHDSCSVSWVPYVGTQYMTVTQQLDAGIRFFDLRCGLKNNVLYMYHGSYDLGMKLSDVLYDIYKWQDGHASEAVITSIKQDHDTVDSTMTFAAAAKAQFDSAADRWYLQDSTPSLGSVRHKLVLMRRYSASGAEAVGIDVTNWPDNLPKFHITTPGGVKLTVQDMYDLAGTSFEQIISSKMNAIRPLLNDAAVGASDRWYVNFTSGVASISLSTLTPYDVAIGGYSLWEYVPGVNPRLEEDLSKRGKVRYGLVPMDFPELPADDVITTIVSSNL